ncbi:unnamed protein product [Amoebophrya sp. A25]|nr:unnamed protein product [Amoebophrya sp. A25]|eukprot:GSA25T00002083001.1
MAASSKPILLVNGFGHFRAEDCLTTQAFTALCKEKKVPFEIVSFDFQKPSASGPVCRGYVEKAHDQFAAIVIIDLSVCFTEFMYYLGGPIEKYVRGHKGCVAFPTTEGGSWLSRCGTELFPEIKWKFDGYYRAKHCAVQQNASNVSRFFPGKEEFYFSVKSCMMKNVPVEERFFATREGSQLFGGMFGNMLPSGPAKPDRGTEDGTATCVAVKSGGSIGGTLGYFGDVNAEASIMSLVLSLVQNAAAPKMVADASVVEAHGKFQPQAAYAGTSEITRKELQERLLNGVVTIVFDKVSTDLTRRMLATRDLSLVNVSRRPKDMKAHEAENFSAEGVIKVFDLLPKEPARFADAAPAGWRSFHFESITDIIVEGPGVRKYYFDKENHQDDGGYEEEDSEDEGDDDSSRLSDDVVTKYFEGRKKKFPEIYQDQDTIFGFDEGQHPNGTRLRIYEMGDRNRPITFTIRGSAMKSEFGDDEEEFDFGLGGGMGHLGLHDKIPKYRVTDKSGEVLHIPIEDCHGDAACYKVL